jgi:hypothetical protein
LHELLRAALGLKASDRAIDLPALPRDNREIN